MTRWNAVNKAKQTTQMFRAGPPTLKPPNIHHRLPYNCRFTYATMRAKFQHTSPIFCSATGFRALMSLLMHA